MSNTMFAIWIGLSAGILLLFLYAAFLNLRRRQAPGVELGELMNSFLPVDVAVLSNVISPAQQRYLQETFGRDELLRLYREQVGLTMECLRRMSHNAALLQQVGYAQVNSGNQLIASLAQEMVDAGVHVRLYTFMALIVLQVRSTAAMAAAVFSRQHRRRSQHCCLKPAAGLYLAQRQSRPSDVPEILQFA